MQFWKLHGLGNHFVFVLHEDGVDYPRLSQFLCQAQTGVGADGILSVDLETAPPAVRMWNPDGTEDFCGNGMCCAVKLIQVLRGITVSSLQTPYGEVEVSGEEESESVSKVRITIDRPTFDPDAIPLATQFGRRTDTGFDIDVDDRKFSVIPSSNGNIHSVIFIDEPLEDEFFERYSPKIETHPLFPNKTNVLWCFEKDRQLHMRIWERSVGETLSCGTGSAAAVAIFELAERDLPSPAEVVMRGGTAKVELKPEKVELTTKAAIVFQGKLIDFDLQEFLNWEPSKSELGDPNTSKKRKMRSETNIPFHVD